MIVVIDTSVWISALHFALRRGTPFQAVLKATREHTISLCDPIEDEIVRILHEKFRWNVADVLPALDAVLPFPLRTNVSGSLHVCRDPNDDMQLPKCEAPGPPAGGENRRNAALQRQ